MELSIGEQVRLYRKRSGMSQAELAKKAKLSRNIIAQIEVGKGNPTIDTLRKIGKALKLNLHIELEAVE